MEELKVEKIAQEAIDKAKEGNAILVTCVDGYITDDEAVFLRDMLWYANKVGVEVRFIPPATTI